MCANDLLRIGTFQVSTYAFEVLKETNAEILVQIKGMRMFAWTSGNWWCVYAKVIWNMKIDSLGWKINGMNRRVMSLIVMHMIVIDCEFNLD